MTDAENKPADATPETSPESATESTPETPATPGGEGEGVPATA